MIVALDTLKPHKRNYNKHPEHQVKRLVASLRKFGQRKPITTWRNTVLTGHGVFLAAKQLAWKEIDIAPCPDEWTEEMALAWLAADNELARLADPDLAQLAEIIEEARNHDAELLEAIGFDEAEFSALLDKLAGDDLYSRKVESPVYTPTGEKPAVKDLFDNSRTAALVNAIEASPDITEDEKAFLIAAAQRHTVLHFNLIAEYYAHASAPAQRLMEDNALVIIDFERAIELGFVRLTQKIADLVSEEYDG